MAETQQARAASSPVQRLKDLFSRHPGQGLGVIVLLFAAGLSCALWGYFQHQREAVLQEAQEQLGAIADLRVAQLQDWWEERQTDARVIQSLFAVTGEEVHWENCLPLLAELQPRRYERVLLLDCQLQPRAGLPARLPPLEPEVWQLASQALRTGRILTSAMYQGEETAEVYLDLAVPIWRKQVALEKGLCRRTQPGSELAGVVLLSVNVRKVLFPKIEAWPAGSATTETMLVRREDDIVVCLTQPRFAASGVVGQFWRLEEPEQIAALAVRGQQGAIMGNDYRGIRVRAAARFVPGLGCYLIAKQDEKELRQPLIRSTQNFVLVQAMLALSAIFGVGYVWRSRENRFTQRQLLQQQRTTQALRQGAERLRGFTEATFEGIVLTEGGRLVDTNEQFLEMLGLERRQALGQPAAQLLQVPPPLQTQRAASPELSGSFETRLAGPSGRTLDVEVRCRMLQVEARRLQIWALRDISERKKQEQDLYRLNRLYRLLGRVNSATVCKHARQELFEEVCRAAVESGGFGTTWVAWLDPATERVQAAAWAGEAHGYPANYQLTLDGGAASPGALGAVLRSGNMCVSNDFLADERFQSLHELYRLCGFRAVGVFPLLLQGKLCGALVVHAFEKDFFQQPELELLQEISRDISTALDRFESEQERQRMETALRQSEYWLKQSQRVAKVGSFVLDLKRWTLSSSVGLDELLGFDKTFEGDAAAWRRLIHPADWAIVEEFGRELLAQKPTLADRSIECRILRPSDGQERWLSGRGRLVWDEARGDAQLQGVVRDITQRKRNELVRSQMELQLRQAQKMEAIGNLAAGIAHEINTPAQFTEHNLQFLQEVTAPLLRIAACLEETWPAIQSGVLPPKVRLTLESELGEGLLSTACREIPGAIQESLHGMERIRKIVLAMKEFAYSGKGRLGQAEPTNLKKALLSTITVAESEWKYVAELKTDFDPALPLVPVLPGEFNEVVLNLLVNAAQAIAEAQQIEPSRKGCIRMSTRLDGEYAEVRVCDNGIGIPEANQHRIFELFFTTKDVGKGSGQGLALAHTIIKERHGGTLSFESKPGQGTCFVIRLPLVPAQSGPGKLGSSGLNGKSL